MQTSWGLMLHSPTKVWLTLQPRLFFIPGGSLGPSCSSINAAMRLRFDLSGGVEDLVDPA